jgi:hypothetical protein
MSAEPIEFGLVLEICYRHLVVCKAAIGKNFSVVWVGKGIAHGKQVLLVGRRPIKNEIV